MSANGNPHGRRTRWIMVGSAVLLVFLVLGWWIFWFRPVSQAQVQSSNLGDAAQELIADPLRFVTNRFTGGIGAALALDPASSLPVVTSVIPGSPAEEAGLKSEDILLEIDKLSTQGKTLMEVVETIRGLTIGNVSIVVQRDGTNLNKVISRTSWKTIRQLGNIQEVPPGAAVPRLVMPVQQLESALKRTNRVPFPTNTVGE